jgi:hypothetical protein
MEQPAELHTTEVTLGAFSAVVKQYNVGLIGAAIPELATRVAMDVAPTLLIPNALCFSFSFLRFPRW